MKNVEAIEQFVALLVQYGYEDADDLVYDVLVPDAKERGWSLFKTAATYAACNEVDDFTLALGAIPSELIYGLNIHKVMT